MVCRHLAPSSSHIQSPLTGLVVISMVCCHPTHDTHWHDMRHPLTQISNLNYIQQPLRPPTNPGSASQSLVQHSHSSSLSKRPLFLPSREQSDSAYPKRLHSFRNDTQAYNFPGISHSNPPITLPVCAICLGRQKHSMPVIQCPAKRTWDNKHDMYCERVNKAIHTREGGTTLCSLWQRDCSCHDKHDHMHLCSGYRALTHGASRCPQAQRAPPANTV